ncbi:Transposase [Paracidovorax anthurii]|uniref:Uncharacterized protein n=1 Tax=Paracidovorax anthurii TaxID=78229 RepID=A0A328Z1Q2_9BURK|nr:hypothetical protein AX018_102470 [Paracidovorax anthurii]
MQVQRLERYLPLKERPVPVQALAQESEQEKR